MRVFIERFLRGKPEYTINLKGEEFHAEALLQFYVICQTEQEKLNAVKHIYESTQEGQTILFCAVRMTSPSIGLPNLQKTEKNRM